MSTVSPTGPRTLFKMWWPHIKRPALLVLALLISLTVYWVVLHSSHRQMRDLVRVDTQQRAGQTAHALSLQINTVVRKLDYFSRHLSWAWANESPAAFNNAATTAINTLPPNALVQVAIADAQGKIRYSRLDDGSVSLASDPAVSIADRPHFIVHAQAKKSFLHIGPPVKGRISKQWTIQFTRGIWRDNLFLGVVVLSVPAEHMAAALKAIFPNPADAASLINSEGTYLARSYYLPEVLGKTLPPSRPFVQHPELNKGIYEVVADVDNIDRLYSWHRVSDYPLIILVGLSAKEALKLTDEAISDSHWQSGFGSGLLLLSGLSLAWLWTLRNRQSSQLQETASALKASEAQLRITLDAVRDGLWEYDHLSNTTHWAPRIQEMLGYSSDYEHLPLNQLLDLIHPDDLDHLKREAVSLFTAGTDQTMALEFRLRQKNGRWLWVLARGKVVDWLANGVPLRSVGTLTDINEHMADRRLREALLNRSAAAILLVDPDRNIIEANKRFLDIFLPQGRPLSSLKTCDLHVDEDHWRGMNVLYDQLREQGWVSHEYPFKDAAGQTRWFGVHAVLQDPDDLQSNVIWTWIDITRRHEADVALVLETLRLTTLLENFPGGVLIEDAKDRVVFVNDFWPDLLGLDVPARTLNGISDATLRAQLGEEVSGWLRSPHAVRSTESRRSHEVKTKAGKHLEIEHVEIRQNDAYLGSVWLVRDITQRKQNELELARLASTDALTTLPNRRSFMQTFERLYTQVHAPNEPAGIVMMLDIDHFKRVNDTYGHAAGDIVLRDLAKIVKNALRDSDTPGRLGGEEFAVLLPNTGLADGLQVAERIRKDIENAVIDADGQAIKITISIGVTLIDYQKTADNILQRADEALYRAKESGRNRVCHWVQT